MLGFGAKGHTAQNLLREKECVLNLPAAAMVESVNKLARFTGSDPVPSHKQAMGYRYEKDKLGDRGACSDTFRTGQAASHRAVSSSTRSRPGGHASIRYSPR